MSLPKNLLSPSHSLRRRNCSLSSPKHGATKQLPTHSQNKQNAKRKKISNKCQQLAKREAEPREKALVGVRECFWEAKSSFGRYRGNMKARSGIVSVDVEIPGQKRPECQVTATRASKKAGKTPAATSKLQEFFLSLEKLVKKASLSGSCFRLNSPRLLR